MAKLTRAQRYLTRKVWETYNHCCAACASPLDIELDHVHPRHAGGTDDADNLQVLCHHCNNAKNGLVGLPKLRPQTPEYDVRVILDNRTEFLYRLETFRSTGHTR